MYWFTHVYDQETADNSEAGGHLLTLGPYTFLYLARQAAETRCTPGSGLAACVSQCGLWSSTLSTLEGNHYYCDPNAFDQDSYENTKPVWQS